MPRDPERTRHAILQAALREFSRVGHAGARVDRIAADAGVNKRMLYHYFRNKEGLYRALLADHERLPAGASAHIEDGPAARVAALDRDFATSPDWVRLLMWGELDGTIRFEDSSAGRAPEAAQLELALQAVALIPYAFPALSRAITGLDPADPELAARRSTFFRVLGRLQAAPPKPRLRLTPDVVGR